MTRATRRPSTRTSGLPRARPSGTVGRTLAALLLALLASVGLASPATAAPLPSGRTVAVPTVAAADPATDALGRFRSGSRVYQAPGLDLVDGQALRARIGDSPIYLAVLPAGVSATTALDEIRAGIPTGTVAVLVGGNLAASSTTVGNVADLLSRARAAHSSGGLTKANVQATFLQFVDDVKAGRGSGVGAGTVVALVVVGVVVLAGVVALGFALVRRRKRAEAVEQQERVEVQGLLQRLGDDVLTLQPNGDPEVTKALGDAGERYNAATPMLAQADDVPKLVGVRRVVLEGLAASRLARTKLGLDPGPDPDPPVVAQQEVLQQPATVSVGDQTYVGHPRYAPGYSHYFGGGYAGQQYVPGGWYQQPFWQRGGVSEMAAVAVGGVFGGILLGSLLSPHGSPWGLGGWGGSYGYDGYGSGWGGGFGPGYGGYGGGYGYGGGDYDDRGSSNDWQGGSAGGWGSSGDAGGWGGGSSNDSGGWGGGDSGGWGGGGDSGVGGGGDSGGGSSW